MRIVHLVCATSLLFGCETVAEDPPFADKGLGQWVEMPGVLPTPCAAVWGASAGEIYAVGNGVSVFDGEQWEAVADIPVSTYRAVWGRSAEQMWIGGDDVLLARTPAGWQQQELRDGMVPIEHYSVLALSGNSVDEYALVNTGGKVLLLENEGSAWATPLWYGGDGPARPFPQAPSLLARGSELLVAGDDDLLRCSRTNELGVPAWEMYRWSSYVSADVSIPPLRAIAGDSRFFAAAGGADVVVYRDELGELQEIGKGLEACLSRDAAGIAAVTANQLYVVGRSIRLASPDLLSGVTTSPVEACDADGCALEPVPAAYEETALAAVWADGRATVVAVGHGALRRIAPRP